jgi:hypothetical protein
MKLLQKKDRVVPNSKKTQQSVTTPSLLCAILRNLVPIRSILIGLLEKSPSRVGRAYNEELSVLEKEE